MHRAHSEATVELLALDGQDLEPRAARGRVEPGQAVGGRQQAMAAAARVRERRLDRVAAVQPEAAHGLLSRACHPGLAASRFALDLARGRRRRGASLPAGAPPPSRALAPAALARRRLRPVFSLAAPARAALSLRPGAPAAPLASQAAGAALTPHRSAPASVPAIAVDKGLAITILPPTFPLPGNGLAGL